MGLIIHWLDNSNRAPVELKAASVFSGVADPRIKLNEHSQIELRYTSEEPISYPRLLVGEVEFGLTESVDGERSVYIWRPRRSAFGGGYESLFHNYFGLTQLAIVHGTNDDKLIVFEPIEVLASKITAERTEGMLKYIMEESDSGLLNDISPVSVQVEQKSSGITPGRMLDFIDNVLSQVEQISSNLLRKPLTVLRPSVEVVRPTPTSVLDDQSLAWFIDNLSSLEISDNQFDSTFEYMGEWYKAREVLSSTPKSTTDIYENRVIHYFLHNLYRSTLNLLREYSYYTSSFQENSDSDGYVSFYNLIRRSLKRNSLVFQQRAEYLVRRIKKLLGHYSKLAPVRHVRVPELKVTQRAKSDRHYLKMMKIIKLWLVERDIDWGQMKLFQSINNAPKLLEIYSCLNLNKALKIMCKETDYDGLFKGEYRGAKVSLYYEPTYYKSNFKATTEGVINTEIAVRKQSLKNRDGLGLTGRFLQRTPDFVIRMETKSPEGGNTLSIIVMDAKYTKNDLAYEKYLKDCVMKYVHGLHGIDGENIVVAMMIIHPNTVREEEVGFLDYHMYPYSLNGEYTVFPVLGGLSMNISASGDQEMLSQFLNNLLEKVYLTRHSLKVMH